MSNTMQHTPGPDFTPEECYKIAAEFEAEGDFEGADIWDREARAALAHAQEVKP